MEGPVVKLTKARFRSYASVQQALKQGGKAWTTYEWTDPPGTQYPTRESHEADECVFMQQGNMVFTNMVTGDRYNVEAGDRLFLPRGTLYSTMTQQGASYYWCSKPVAPKAANDADDVPDAALPANTETPW